MRVLVCDDHALFAESLAAALNQAGYEVRAVTYSPDQALAALAQYEIDVCLLDVQFPDGNIITRLPELRRLAPAAHPVLLSAEMDTELIAAALAAGIRGIADKGATFADICTTLDRVYAGEIVAESRSHPTRAGTSPPGEAQRLARLLTRREREVLCHLVGGKDTKAMARSMRVTISTARSHTQRVLTKLNVHTRLEATTIAVRSGMVSGDTGDWLL